MKNYQDAYGQVLLSVYNGDDNFEIIEREDGYIDAGHAARYFTPYKDWHSHQRKAMRYVKGRVLDIGCGVGRHSLYLQERGYDVLGIDVSPLAIKVCTERGLKNTRIMSITQVSSKLGTFDTILMLGNNFGLFGSWKRARWLLRKFHKMTSESGRIIAETLDPYRTTEPSHFEYHKRNKNKGRMPGQVRIRIRFKKYIGNWMDYLFVSKEEMEEILTDTDWKVRKYLDSKGAAYIAIIEKVMVHDKKGKDLR